VVTAGVVVFLGYVGRGLYQGAGTIGELLAENRQLKEAITNLTEEDQIGYAKVVRQVEGEDGLYTTIRFVETARDSWRLLVTTSSGGYWRRNTRSPGTWCILTR